MWSMQFEEIRELMRHYLQPKRKALLSWIALINFSGFRPVRGSPSPRLMSHRRNAARAPNRPPGPRCKLTGIRGHRAGESTREESLREAVPAAQTRRPRPEGQGSTSPFRAPLAPRRPRPTPRPYRRGTGSVEQIVGHGGHRLLALAGQDVRSEASTLALDAPAG